MSAARCDECGTWTEALEDVDGRQLCLQCRDEDEAKTDEGDAATATSGKKEERESQGTQIVKLAVAADVELFHNPAGEPFATLPVDGRRETWPLRTKAVRRWLSRLYYESSEKAASSEGTQSALGVLEGKALFDGSEHVVHVRVAEHEGRIYLDLADAEWQAVEITSAGWRVVADPPVKFRRARGMLPLPMPRAGGSLDDLREFLNFATEDDFRLMVAWLVMAIRPVGPYPVLALHGEQGSGKSTAAEVLRSLVDPNEALLRPPPRDERDLVIAGSNGRVVALENLSVIQQWCSDALCRIATGSGFGTRQLYTDDEEALFKAQLPIVLNGIVEVVLSGDLQDRSIVLMLPTITEYVSEDELWEEFERQQPRLLGALLDVVASAMGQLDRVRLDRLPRMADFAIWIAGACPALGWNVDDFLGAYTRNRSDANETTLGASPLVAPLRGLGNFEGTATKLLAALVELVTPTIARSKEWPKSPAVLSGALRRLAPNLRRAHPPVEIEFDRVGHERRRIIRLGKPEWVRERASAASAASAQARDADDTRPHADGDADGPDDENGPDQARADDADGADDEIHTHSDPADIFAQAIDEIVEED